jgi:hypothetical protein
MRSLVLPLLALSLAACGRADKPHAPASENATGAAPSASGDAEAAGKTAGPNLAACKPYGKGEYRDRSASPALTFPEKLKGIVASRPDQLAVLTLSGTTLCSDARWQDRATNARLSPDGRFLGYDWSGYEAWGHMLIDRSGTGTAIETGSRPAPSPSGQRLASIESSESGFEAFSGIMVLRADPAPLKVIDVIENLPEGLTDWRFDRWQGESCFEISAVRFEDLPATAEVTPKTPRRRFITREVNTQWRLEALDACPAK